MLLPRSLHVLLVIACSPFTLADVEFTSPAPGDEVAGGTTLRVQWKDSGDAPSLADLKSYKLFLCAGGNANPVQLAALTEQGVFSTGNSASGTVSASIGASEPENAYFLRMESVATVGGTVINYSKRFSLTGMTGTFPQAVLDGMEDVTGLDGPPTKNDVAGQQASQTIAEGLYGVPYNEQTGPTKYCPMQPLPPTKIIKDKPTPLWPTSGVTFAKTFMPTPQQVTTLTLAQTFSVASRMNDAAPAPHPSDDMAKFLARWKD